MDDLDKILTRLNELETSYGQGILFVILSVLVGMFAFYLFFKSYWTKKAESIFNRNLERLKKELLTELGVELLTKQSSLNLELSKKTEYTIKRIEAVTDFVKTFTEFYHKISRPKVHRIMGQDSSYLNLWISQFEDAYSDLHEKYFNFNLFFQDEEINKIVDEQFSKIGGQLTEIATYYKKLLPDMVLYKTLITNEDYQKKLKLDDLSSQMKKQQKILDDLTHVTVEWESEYSQFLRKLNPLIIDYLNEN